MMFFQRLLLVLMLVIKSYSVFAIDTQVVPEVLKPWIPWVLADYPQAECPFLYHNFQQKHCSWSGPLRLELENQSGRFSGEWTLYQAGWVILPGDQKRWPQRVLQGQKPAIVSEYHGKPAIWLPAGHHLISGEFFWDKLPESLTIARETGLIQLIINNEKINYPRIEKDVLWLGSEQISNNDNQQDSLDLQVFRQIIDDNPMQMVTHLLLNVSGVAREVSIAHALLPEFIPISVDSPFSARIDNDGRLLLQVRPGQWTIKIHSRYPQQLMQIDLAVNDRTWPESEIWAFKAMPALRLVEIENLAPIDASLTNLPEEWRLLPSYQVKQGGSMRFKLIRRGDPDPEPNKLRLNRKLWLDFAGDGYTVSDRINGKMTRDWRINALTQTHLGQVLLNGQNQLITQTNDAQQGVEVRRGTVELQADSRIMGNGRYLNAVGWQQSFQQVQAELNIPPGWRLLAVFGVDNEPNSWLTQWTLLDIFLVLIIALAISRLWSWQWGLLALISLMLFWHEADAPHWIWLNILAALALLRVLPKNRFSHWVTWYRNLCWLGLVVIVIPFMIAQIRMGIYPQLEKPWQPIEAVPYAANVSSRDEMLTGAAMEMSEAPAPQIARKMYKTNSTVADSGTFAVNFDRIDPDANIQTGPGLPQWQWQTVQLSWNGAVDSQQQIQLWYLPPPWTLVWHFLQALLVALMSLKVLGIITTKMHMSLPGLSVWLLLPILILPNTDSFADIPDQGLLDQLKTQLLKAPECLPACAEIASMKLTATENEMLIDLQVHVQQDVAIPLPAQLEQWLPEQVAVDGKQTNNLMRENDGYLWLALNKGVHRVLLYGRHNQKFRFSLPLPLKPKYSEVKVDGWRVEGLYENHQIAAQLEFNRIDTDPQFSETGFQEKDLAAFVRVERTLHLGLDWHVTTQVMRLPGNDNPIVLQIPLLPGEAITSDQIHIENGKVLVNMSAGQNMLEWHSLLEKRQQLELQATDTSAWSEIWRADVSPIWHLQATGIAVVHHLDQQDTWLPEWRPWPGEKVILNISRPEPVPGQTLTIDKSQLNLQPGKRNQVASLSLNLRSSKGGQHNIILPAQAELQGVSIDGVTQPIRQKADTVTLPIHPGTQQITLNWQVASEQSLLFTTPLVNLGVDSVNSNIQVTTASDRWVLFTLGPKFGPAALIWGMLLVLLLLALGLGRSTLTPLKSWQWFLLLIGLSQIHVGAGLIVVIWLFALGVRRHRSQENINQFNLTQVGLGFLTLASVLLLFAAVQQGLLGSPDMQITGNQSTPWILNWYQDHSGPVLPTAAILSVPMMVYRILMLGWSLWMALSLLDWLRWGWSCFASGSIWKKKVPQKLVTK
jgi:hypothetical protein